MSEMVFKEIPFEQWEQFPVSSHKQKPDRYGELVGQLEQGKIVVLETENENDLRGKRIAIGRRARLQGFLAEFRVNGNQLAVRKSDAPLTERKPTKPREKKAKEE